MAHEFLKDVSAAAETAVPIEVGRRYRRKTVEHFEALIHKVRPDGIVEYDLLLDGNIDLVGMIASQDYIYKTYFVPVTPLDASARLEKATELIRKLWSVLGNVPTNQTEFEKIIGPLMEAEAFLAEGSK